MSDDAKSYLKKNGWNWQFTNEPQPKESRPTHWKYGATKIRIPRISVHVE